MKNIPRKISFSFLTFKIDDSTLNIIEEITTLFNYLQLEPKKAKKIDLSENKFCFLDYCEFDSTNNAHKLVFKSATHSYRANLINKKTVEERINPKSIDEGEGLKTHLIIKYKSGDAIMLLEASQKGLNSKHVVYYLNYFISKYNANHKIKQLNYFNFALIPRDDFREVLESMSRVVTASIYVEKQILGSEALNYSERLGSAQEDIIISVKTKKNESIKNFAYDAFALLSGGKSKINKIKIEGKNSSKNDVIIDTDFIVRKEYVETQINEDTGEIYTPNMLIQMTELSNTL